MRVSVYVFACACMCVCVRVCVCGCMNSAPGRLTMEVGGQVGFEDGEGPPYDCRGYNYLLVKKSDSGLDCLPPAPSLTGCVVLGKFLGVSVPWLPHLETGVILMPTPWAVGRIPRGHASQVLTTVPGMLKMLNRHLWTESQ